MNYLPKRLSLALVDSWAFLAGNNTRLVSIVTRYQRLGRATRRCQVALYSVVDSPSNFVHFFVNANILHVPFPHLLKVQEFVVLVQRPAHVENNGMNRSIEQRSHEVARLLIELVASWKLFHVTTQYLGLQAIQAHVFGQERNQGLLVTVRL